MQQQTDDQESPGTIQSPSHYLLLMALLPSKQDEWQPGQKTQINRIWRITQIHLVEKLTSQCPYGNYMGSQSHLSSVSSPKSPQKTGSATRDEARLNTPGRQVYCSHLPSDPDKMTHPKGLFKTQVLLPLEASAMLF